MTNSIEYKTSPMIEELRAIGTPEVEKFLSEHVHESITATVWVGPGHQSKGRVKIFPEYIDFDKHTIYAEAVDSWAEETIREFDDHIPFQHLHAPFEVGEVLR